MKILYIPSGYGQIYQSFDQSINRALTKLGHPVSCISLFEEQKLKNAVNSFKPDVCITMIGFKMPTTTIEWLKKIGIKLAVWMTEDPYYIDQSLKLIDHYDYVFTIDNAALKLYKEAGHQHAYYLPLGTDPEIYYPTTPAKEYDICLVGYPYPERVKMIHFLLEKTNFSIQVVGSQWEKKLGKVKHSSKLTIHSRWVPPIDTKNHYNRASINLNTHRPFNLKQNKNTRGVVNESINNRTFDIASCGAFQLIEFKPDLPQHFFSGKEIVSFNNNDELLKKVKYYLRHSNKRQEIAANAREKVLNNHTFVHRMNNMVNIINNS
ncbi:CgeB family protein [Halalkalibacter lacteus]|uniref:CgeB family protein n=1 Tax=Halalkalibacter lacteus TaxID=3090663 RepID=UPI002FC960E0